MSSISFIDLFSGAGGLSEGFLRAGFTPIAHVEADKSACKTIETRLIYHDLKKNNCLKHYYNYIHGKLSRDEFIKTYGKQEITNSVINLPIGDRENKVIFDKIDFLASKKTIDVIIGGPPCQAYSLIGRARDKNQMKNDPRNLLYEEYAKFLKRYTPKVFVFENVTGLITAKKGEFFKNMKACFKSIGYELDYNILDSSEFGVIQKRKRVILIGWQKGLPFEYPRFQKIKNNFIVEDIFEDLKKIKPGHNENLTRYTKPINKYLKDFEIRSGIDIVTQHITRNHNDRDLKIYKIAILKLLKNNERLKYPDLPSSLKTHKNEKAFIDRFKVVNPKDYSHTMVAHISKDGHYYIYPDLNQVRSLSVREAARIQSFPDDFYFEGGRTAAFRQIGNAVPPLMGKNIAESIKQQLCKKNYNLYSTQIQ